jgi:zinc transport system permease protein
MFTNLYQNPLFLIILASIGLGVSIPVIGSFLIVQRKSGLVDSLSHISMLGAGLGVWLGINPYLFAVILSIFVTLSIFEFGQKIPYKEAILSVFTGFSLAFIAIIKKLSGIRINLESIFYGNINSINFGDLCLILGVTVLVLGVIAKWYREFLWITIDEDLAKTQSINVPKYRIIFNILASLVFALYIQIFGILIISILSITPILISNFLVKGFKPKILSSVVIGVVSLLLSVIISYSWLDYSISSVLALVLIAIFGVSYSYRAIQKSK